MNTSIDQAAQSVTLTFNNQEWDVVQRARQRGQNEFRDHILAWLRSTATTLDQDDRSVLEIRLKNATRAELVALKNALGI